MTSSARARNGLGWTLDELLEKTLHAMADTESTVAEELNLLLQA